LTFGGTTFGITSVNVTDDAGFIDTTISTDSTHVGVPGTRRWSMDANIVGCSTLTAGATGTLAVAWNDGQTSGNTSDTWFVQTANPSGALDGAINTAVTFAPYSSS